MLRYTYIKLKKIKIESGNPQIRIRKFSDAIARKLAKFHRLAVPINKDAGWLFKTMTK
jgi:hypothetical protein